MQTRDSIKEFELAERSKALVDLAVSRDTRWAVDPIETFVARSGHARLVPMVKAAVDAHTTADEGAALQPLTAAFVASVDRQSILGQLDGAQRVPLGLVGRLQTGVVTATVVSEGAEKPVGRIEFELSGTPSKAVGQIVVTAEYLRALNPVAQEGITRSLVSATAEAVNVQVVTAFTAGAPAASSDVGTLLSSISGGSPAKPYIIGGYDTLVPLAPTLADLRGLGVGIIATPAAAGQLIAVDASGVLFGDGGATVSTARHALMTLDDGTGGTPGPTVNLWQANLACLRAERWFQIAFRPDAVAWSAVGSP